ncbi:hypothetical protein B0I35DRAFT_474076 [Stachybotrys elegans]|uniref:Uncharacterized protein n=1 Tax=Stachybotrys elegans TaxID=80388 RepID=A0A8K0T540_9HYPO|nr:hypothetical protein B0I35DRAFT_474076 [Stachybotrys elegans]
MPGDDDDDDAPSRAATTHVSDLQGWSRILRSQRRPLLTHLNGDTTWLLQIPYPPAVAAPRGRSHFNVLLDPWLQGPQSDVAWWFSTQWHVVPPGVATMAKLDEALREVEGGALVEAHEGSYVDVVAISHEFTDHCHRATLEELPKGTPVFATDVAAQLIRSWNHFDKVFSIPGLCAGIPWTKLPVGPLPDWLGIGSVITEGDALYYHSALLIAFDTNFRPGKDPSSSSSSPASAEAIIYSPHGIKSQDLAGVPSCGVRTLALLHGLHDVRIWMMKQLNLGALNGIKAVGASGARYWVATHDEVKTGGGFIAPLLMRTQYTLKEAVRHQHERLQDQGKAPRYEYLELGSGDGVMLV